MSRSVAKALNSFLVLQLMTLQMCSLEEDFFSIDRNLTSQGLE